ncbi:hypothetical protein BHU72_05205 [Desulfuribacillus stibiiarsenatis]|uniref:dTDP-4-dehydrorhamnose reductase n=1 Tax=Desulfuribacillus stibiiarsenatis TaxID=1390249 RepID=A0A1E5L5S8_9FIRM|nr:SDR family oxidoreductase [Desulfuribacillus stibiiarsenatis]OEH85485.1 hypothetical protein BHU72_05205 [Desulfuribacillus stibiiarsenatis]
MKILITGVAGLLGGNLAYLLSKKFNIVGVDRNIIKIPGTTIHSLDLRDRTLIYNFIKKNQPSVVVHCAAATNVDWCEVNEELAYIFNTDVTKQLVDICNELRIKFIFISTDAVFDGVKEGLYRESDEVTPVNVYGKTKALAEHAVMENPNNLVLRTNIYGYNIREKNSFGEWILYSLINDMTLKMFDDVLFSPIIVNDVATIIEQVILSNGKGLYHLCGTGAISKYDFGVQLKEVFSINTGSIEKISVDQFTFKANRTKNMALSNEKISQLLNVEIASPMESIIKFKELYDQHYHEILREFIGGSRNAK